MAVKVYFRYHSETDLKYDFLFSLDSNRKNNNEYIGSRVLIDTLMREGHIQKKKNLFHFPYKESFPFYGLSHTRGLSVVAICETKRVGIDVEKRKRKLSGRVLRLLVGSNDLKGIEQWVCLEAAYKALYPNQKGLKEIELVSGQFFQGRVSGKYQLIESNKEYIFGLATLGSKNEIVELKEVEDRSKNDF